MTLPISPRMKTFRYLFRKRQQLRNYIVMIRHRIAPPRPVGHISWLFVATLPNSGSTALAMLLASAPAAVVLTQNGEGQWLLPELSARGCRWDPNLPVNYPLLRAVWLDAALRTRVAPCVVVEKSPPNLTRLRPLIAAFRDMPTILVRLTRDPYAICASWARRYPPETIVRQWEPALDGRLSSEDAYFRALGTICGQRLQMMAAASELAALTISYEALTTDPSSVVNRLRAAVPLLEGIDPTVQVRVKDYTHQKLSNMNAVQIATLTASQLTALSDGLSPYEASVKALGYTLR